MGSYFTFSQEDIELLNMESPSEYSPSEADLEQIYYQEFIQNEETQIKNANQSQQYLPEVNLEENNFGVFEEWIHRIKKAKNIEEVQNLIPDVSSLLQKMQAEDEESYNLNNEVEEAFTPQSTSDIPTTKTDRDSPESNHTTFLKWTKGMDVMVLNLHKRYNSDWKKIHKKIGFKNMNPQIIKERIEFLSQSSNRKTQKSKKKY